MQVKSNDEPLPAAKWPLNDEFSRIVREKRASGDEVQSTPLCGKHWNPKAKNGHGAMTLEPLLLLSLPKHPT